MTKTVLIVDDDAGIRDLLEFKLDTEEFDVETAPDGTACIEYLDENPLPAVVILDVMMPRIDGFEVIERIDESFENAPPVVLLTGTDEAETEGTPDVAARIEKPFTVESVHSTIERVLGPGETERTA